MNREWKHHPVVVGALILAVLVVWASVWLRTQQTAPLARGYAAVEGETGATSNPQLNRLDYVDVMHDPFSPEALGLAAPSDEELDAGDIPRPASVVAHRLQGVIGTTALLIDPTGETHLVRRGDVIDDLEIVRIHATHIQVQLNGIHSDLVLD